MRTLPRRCLICYAALTTVGLFPAAPASVRAEEARAIEPERHLVIAPQAAVHAGEKREAPVPRGSVIVATQARGPWRFAPAARGWIHQQDLIPLDQAVDHFTRVLDSEPSADNYHLRGIARIANRDFQNALGDLQQAYRLGESAVSLHFNLATCFQELGQRERALDELTAILDAYPDELRARLSRGNLHVEAGAFDAALRDFAQAIEVQPDSAEAQHLYGLALRLLGRFEEALAAYDRALEFAPRHADALANRGYVRKTLGEYAAALADYEASLAVAPQSPEVQNDLAWLLATAPDEAVRNPQRAVELAEAICRETHNKNSEYLDTLAAAYAAAGRFDAAREAQKLALVELPPDASRAAMESRLAAYRNGQPHRETPPDPAPAFPAGPAEATEPSDSDETAEPVRD